MSYIIYSYIILHCKEYYINFIACKELPTPSSGKIHYESENRSIRTTAFYEDFSCHDQLGYEVVGNRNFTCSASGWVPVGIPPECSKYFFNPRMLYNMWQPQTHIETEDYIPIIGLI